MIQSRATQYWSAVPTPLAADLTVDTAGVERMVADAVIGGMDGLFVGGTCGEGPWLPRLERVRLIKVAAKIARGRLKIAAQVSDNSVPRVIDNIHDAAEAGADLAIVASPAMMLNATPERIVGFYQEVVTQSVLPVGIYDLGQRRTFPIPLDRLKEIYLLPNVRMVKDSSAAVDRRAIALAAREEKPSLQLFNGDEFHCLAYLQAGYDGFMFGGAVAVAAHMHRIAELFHSGKVEEARAVDTEMKTILYGLYGGESITCWLTGLKYYMVKRGLFETTTSYLEYPLTEECRAFIERYVSSKGFQR
jgi:4-hydroxy-tetrahydrodipicolinate synthase